MRLVCGYPSLPLEKGLSKRFGVCSRSSIRILPRDRGTRRGRGVYLEKSPMPSAIWTNEATESRYADQSEQTNP